MVSRRSAADTLSLRLSEPPKKLCLIVGPRQVGKTMMVRKVLADRPMPACHWLVDADNPVDIGSAGGITEGIALPLLRRVSIGAKLVHID